MEVIERTIIIKHGQKQPINIYPFGDLHVGSIGSDEDAAERMVTRIVNDPYGYIIGMGDYADSILKNDPRFDIAGLASWVKKDNITESQRNRVVEMLTPLAKKGKIIALLTGNHEEEIHIRYQDDITRNICADLKVPYAGYSCFIALNFDRPHGDNAASTHQYIVHAWHGAGAAQTEGARLMRLMRLVNEIQAHIYLMGHLHAMTHHTPDRLIYQRGKVKSIKLAATMTGSWLKTYSQPAPGQELNASYGEMKGYVPSRIGCPIVHIFPETGEFTVES